MLKISGHALEQFEFCLISESIKSNTSIIRNNTLYYLWGTVCGFGGSQPYSEFDVRKYGLAFFR